MGNKTLLVIQQVVLLVMFCQVDGEQLHVTYCHLVKSSPERLQEQDFYIFSCLCINPFSCKYTKAESSATWGLGSYLGCLLFEGVFMVAELKSKEFKTCEIFFFT